MPDVRLSTILFPAEHGTWGWLFVPMLAGIIASGTVNAPVGVFLFASMSAFLIRQPAVVWLRSYLNHSPSQRAMVARNLTIILIASGVVSMSVLFLQDRDELLWLAPVFLIMTAIYLYAGTHGRSALRSVWTELAGAVVLASAAPAAMIAATGKFEPSQLILFFLMAFQNVLGALYVRLRLADLHNKPINRWNILAWHAAAVCVCWLLYATTRISWLTILPFAGFLIRAAWFVFHKTKLRSVKRFGFGELFLELACGVFLAFLLR